MYKNGHGIPLVVSTSKLSWAWPCLSLISLTPILAQPHNSTWQNSQITLSSRNADDSSKSTAGWYMNPFRAS